MNCTRCKKNKFKSDFYVGYKICKQCQSERVLISRAKKPGKYKTYRKKWEKANPDKVLAYSKAYYTRSTSHLPKRQKFTTSYYSRHKAQRLRYQKRYDKARKKVQSSG